MSYIRTIHRVRKAKAGSVATQVKKGGGNTSVKKGDKHQKPHKKKSFPKLQFSCFYWNNLTGLDEKVLKVILRELTAFEKMIILAGKNHVRPLSSGVANSAKLRIRMKHIPGKPSFLLVASGEIEGKPGYFRYAFLSAIQP